MCLSALVLVLIVSSVWTIPPSYVLHVDHDCGATMADAAEVRVLTDLNIRLDVECKSRTMIVDSTDKVNYKFQAKYEGDAEQECLFKQRQNSKVWVLLLTILWSEPNENIRSKRKQYLVTCTLDPHAMNRSDPHHAKQGLLGPYELQGRMGADSSSPIQLQMIDIEGNPLLSHVAIGRKIRLKATMTPENREVGFRTVSCHAVGGNTSYAVLRGGCGDGIIFPRTMGFTTTGLEILSPYFAAFKLRNQEKLSFDCNFTTCMDNCDGDSCTNEPDKRDADTQQVVRRSVVSSSSASLQILMTDHTNDVFESRAHQDELPVVLKAHLNPDRDHSSRPTHNEDDEPEVHGEADVPQAHIIAKDVEEPIVDVQIAIVQSTSKTVYQPDVESNNTSMASRMEDIKEMGVRVIADSCRMTSNGLVCNTSDGVVETENWIDKTSFYELLAVALLLIQTFATVGIVVGLIIANKRTSNS